MAVTIFFFFFFFWSQKWPYLDKREACYANINTSIVKIPPLAAKTSGNCFLCKFNSLSRTILPYSLCHVSLKVPPQHPVRLSSDWVLFSRSLEDMLACLGWFSCCKTRFLTKFYLVDGQIDFPDIAMCIVAKHVHFCLLCPKHIALCGLFGCKFATLIHAAIFFLERRCFVLATFPDKPYLFSLFFNCTVTSCNI